MYCIDGTFRICRVRERTAFLGSRLHDRADAERNQPCRDVDRRCFRDFATLQEIKKENKELKSRLEEMTTENNRLQQNSATLERYKELYKMDQNTADYPKVAANVIASENSNWFSKFTIDKGSNDGIREDMNVLSGTGLVGIVTEVGPNWATVSSIIDDKNVSAMILTTFDKCIVSGDLQTVQDGLLKFEQLANNENEVAVGEQVVTSNISSKYLQGLLVGYISEVNVDSNNLTRSGYIIPATDFKELQEVLVITTTKQDLIDGKGESGSDNGGRIDMKKIKRILICAVLITVCFLLETTVFQKLAFASIIPNLLIIVTSSFGFMRGQKKGLIIGFFVDF